MKRNFVFVALCFVAIGAMLFASTTFAGNKGGKKFDPLAEALTPVPEGRVPYYLVNCGGGSCKDNPVFSMIQINVLPSELGKPWNELRDPESTRQYQAAIPTQKVVMDSMKAMPGYMDAVRAKWQAFTRKHLGVEAAGKAFAASKLESFIEIRRNAGMVDDAVMSAPPNLADYQAYISAESIPIMVDPPEDPDPDQCHFGQPCDSGTCGTILFKGTPGISCSWACTDCRRG